MGIKAEKAARDRKYYTEHKDEKRKYYTDHKEERAAWGRKYRAEHREDLAANSRKYHQEHRDERAAYDRKYYQEHKAEKAAYKRKYQQDNPEKARTKNRKRRALKVSQLGLWHHLEVQIEILMYQVQEGLCYYCGDILDWDNRINSPLEHMTPLSRGGLHGVDNWCISCRDCNQRKHTKTAEEFINL